MKKFSKRFLGWLLCICMVLSYLPAVSLVANAADDWSGMSRTETYSTYGDEEITLTLQTSDYYLFCDSSTEWSVTQIDFNYFQLDDQYQQLESRDWAQQSIILVANKVSPIAMVGT